MLPKIEKLNIEQSFPATDGITKVMANKIDELIASCECRFKALDSCPGELVDCDCDCHKKCEMCQTVDELAPSESWCKTHNYSRKETTPSREVEKIIRDYNILYKNIHSGLQEKLEEWLRSILPVYGQAEREKGYREGVEKALEVLPDYEENKKDEMLAIGRIAISQAKDAIKSLLNGVYLYHKRRKSYA